MSRSTLSRLENLAGRRALGLSQIDLYCRSLRHRLGTSCSTSTIPSMRSQQGLALFNVHHDRTTFQPIPIFDGLSYANFR